MAGGDFPVNRVLPPFGQTSSGIGTPAQDIRGHHSIGHPNQDHLERPAASPFVESAHSARGFAGNPKRRPPFSSTGGVYHPTRK